MITFDEAQTIVSQVAVPLGKQDLPLREADGRVLAKPVVSAIDAPRTDVSAMDGYAVRQSDISAGPARLRVVGEYFPGSAGNGTIAAGESARIFTGAPLPKGADWIVIQEDVIREGSVIIINQPPGESSHVRQRGSDFSSGTTLLEAGQKIGARELVAAAAGDAGTVSCFVQPRITILSTGDELAESGTARDTAGAIPDSVSYGLTALIREANGIVINQERLPDDLGLMQLAAARAVGVSDLVVVTGGASVGERDYAKQMFEPLGLKVLFAKVAMKPGKPVWLGRCGKVLVMGLPGNPTSAMVTARLLLVPLVAGLGGLNPRAALSWRAGVLAGPLPANGDRETFVRAKFDAKRRVLPLSNQNSGAQLALAKASLLIRRAKHAGPLTSGAQIEIVDL